MSWHGGIKVTSTVAVAAVCLFESVLHRQSDIFREYEVALLQMQWLLLACLVVWCATFLFLKFSMSDLLLIGLLVILIAAYSFVARPATEAFTFLVGVTLGKGACVLLKADGRWRMANLEHNSEIVNRKSEIVNFLVGMVGLLAFASWWHLDMSDNFYHGPRWMGLWNNPNIYGMLMGAGVTLAIGMRAEKLKTDKLKTEIGKQKLSRAFARRLLPIFLFIAVFMMGVGLVCSYSRGAWLGTSIGLLYLAWSYGKLKWRYVLPAVAVTAAAVFLFWHATPDTAPWYVKRMDFGRPSAQHRVAAWRGALHMMWDHPFGVGWNKAEEIYEKNYSPPEDGAAAITTNDYLMLGTQLGWPGLICFVTYVGLCFKVGRVTPCAPSPYGPGLGAHGVTRPTSEPAGETPALRCACRAGALAMLVAFWFDGGLFTLATAAVFWILLELGSEKQKLKTDQKAASGKAGNGKAETNLSLVTSAATEKKN